MVTKKEAFTEVMNEQSKFCFLNHQTPTSKEKKQELIKRINTRIKKLQGQLLAFIFISVLGFSLVSCNKQNYDPPTPTPLQREMVTQTFKIGNFVSQPMTKSFDINKWLFIFNPNQYTLNFTSTTNPSDNMSIPLSIDQMIAGASVQLYRGTYNISYLSTHSNYTTLDASINMSNVNIQDTPINMTGNYADALVVIQLPQMSQLRCDNVSGEENPVFTYVPSTDGSMGFYYSYIDGSRDGMVLHLHSNDGSYNSQTNQNDGRDVNINLSSLACGNVYFYCTTLGAQTTLTFPAWKVNRITL